MKKSEKDNLSIAQKYYGIISVVNSLGLTEKEIQLLAFMAVKGSVSQVNVRKEFCAVYKTSSPSINNIVSRLKRKKVILKRNGKINIIPIIGVDFNKDINLEISLEHDS